MLQSARECFLNAHLFLSFFLLQSAERIKENMGAAGVQLSAEEVARLEQEVPADQVVGTRYPGAGSRAWLVTRDARGGKQLLQ